MIRENEPAPVSPSTCAPVDEVVCLETPESFFAVGAFFADFGQVSDEEVVATLRRAALTTGGGP